MCRVCFSVEQKCYEASTICQHLDADLGKGSNAETKKISSHTSMTGQGKTRKDTRRAHEDCYDVLTQKTPFFQWPFFSQLIWQTEKVAHPHTLTVCPGFDYQELVSKTVYVKARAWTPDSQVSSAKQVMVAKRNSNTTRNGKILKKKHTGWLSWKCKLPKGEQGSWGCSCHWLSSRAQLHISVTVRLSQSSSTGSTMPCTGFEGNSMFIKETQIDIWVLSITAEEVRKELQLRHCWSHINLKHV